MDDPLVHCPFDLAHTCKQSRFQKHLIKCRKNHPESKLEPCPYNATEYIHPDNLIEHLKVCKNAKLLEGQKYMAEIQKENYLDAPFHMPKQKVEEDFEGKEVSVDDTDERVLERSVSQMSLNSISSTQSLGGNDNEILNVKSLTPPRTVNELPSRASSLRGVGRGHAMARLISVMHQMDGMDYSKYEIRSTITEDKSQAQDQEFAPPAKFDRGQRGSVSLTESKRELDESKFEDCSSEEELEACDNVSVCSSQSTIIENNSASLENNRLSWAATPEPQKVISVYSDSEDDETHISNDREADDSVVRFNCTSPRESVSVNCISVCREESPDVVSNGRESSSSCSFYSLIRENLLQNEYIVRGVERNEERMAKFGRGRSGYHSQNRPYRSHEATFEPGGAHSPSVGGRGAMLNSFRNSNAQSNYTNNRGQPHHFNQNGYQNFPNQGQRPPSNYNNQGGHSNRNQKNNQNSNQNQYAQRPYSNQSNQGSYSDQNQNGYQNSLSRNQHPRNQSNQGSFSNQNRGRGLANEANSIGRGFHNRMNSFGAGDSCSSNSIGRGNLADRLGDVSQQNNSVGRGKLICQSSTRGSFNQENSFSRGNHRNKDNSVHNGNTSNQEQFVGRGSFRNQENSFNRQGFSNQESFGRGNSLNQVHSIGRGSYNQENHAFNQVKPFGRGSQLANLGSAEGQASSIGRGHMLTKPGVPQFPNWGNSESVGRGRPMTNHYGNADNFRGKSSEFSHPSFEAVYNSFKDLQISDYSPTTNPTFQDLNFQGPKQINQGRAEEPFAQVPSGGGATPLQTSSSSLSQPKEPSANPIPKKNKPKTKKKKKKQTSKSALVDSSAKSDTNAENPAQTSDGSNIKILDKSMDPKKYFGADSDGTANVNQDSNEVNCNQDNPKTISNQDSSKVKSIQDNPETSSNQDNNKANSNENSTEANLKQNGSKVKSKQNSKKRKSKQKSSTGDSKQDVSNSDLKVNGNVSQRTSNCNVTKSYDGTVTALNLKSKFQVYDQFYSNMSYGPLTSHVHLNYDPKKQNKFDYQGSTAQQGRFSKRIEDERQQANPRVAYASVNFIRVSGKPVESASAGNVPPSPSNVPQNVVFSSLHQPQKPRAPGRYDKLCGTGYKFQLRHLNKKPKVLSYKPKIVNHGKKPQNPSTVSVNQPDLAHVIPAKKLYNPSVNMSQACISNVSLGEKSSNPTTVNKVNQSSETVAQKTGISCNAGIKSKQRKSAKISSTANGPSNTKVFLSQVRRNGFEKQKAGSEMSLWNKKSYSKINPGNESSLNRSHKPQMSQWNFGTSNMNNVQPNSFVKFSGGDEPSFFPSFQNPNSSFVKNVHSKKQSFAVLKEKINPTQRKSLLKNQNSNASRPRLRHPHGLNFLSMLSNPFEKPVAFGPPQSSHLEYSSHKPLAFNPFEL